MRPGFFQLLVVRPLVRSILGTLGLLTTEEQVDSFIGSVVRQFLPSHEELELEHTHVGQKLLTWQILIQMDADVGLTTLKVQAVINSTLGKDLSEVQAQAIIDALDDDDSGRFLSVVKQAI